MTILFKINIFETLATMVEKMYMQKKLNHEFNHVVDVG
jgi:hypothetical protein